MGILAFLAAASWLPAAARERAAPDYARTALEESASHPVAAATPNLAVSYFLFALGRAGRAAATAGIGPEGAAPASSSAAAGPGPDAAATPGTNSPGNPSQQAPPPEPPAGGGSASATAGAAPSSEPAANATTAYAEAYAYLEPAWQSRLPFGDFMQRWSPFGLVEPLAVISAGHPPGAPREARVFAEARCLVPLQSGTAVVYAYGFFVAAPERGTWRLQDGSLSLQGFTQALADAGSSAGPDSAAVAAARAAARRAGRPLTPVGSVHVGTPPGPHRALVRVALGERTYLVRLFELVDGSWVALEVD